MNIQTVSLIKGSSEMQEYIKVAYIGNICKIAN